MIITTELLNNIETNLTNPQPQGIYYITIDESDNLSANYNQVIAQLEAGNLPMIIEEEDDDSITLFIATGIFYKDNMYMLVTNNDDMRFYAESPNSFLFDANSLNNFTHRDEVFSG